MPALGMAQETGKILRWLKTEGESVRAGEIIMEIETDKAVVEIEAAASGTLARVTAGEGDEVPVGQPIALILAEGESVEQHEPASVAGPLPSPGRIQGTSVRPVAARIAAEHNLDITSVQAAGPRIEKQDVLKRLETKTRRTDRVLASPKARRLAAERQIEIRSLTGSGPAGVVLAGDVLAAQEAPVQPPPSTIELSSTWKLMADRVTQAWTQVPHIYLLREARADGLITWKDRAQRRLGSELTYTDLLVKVVAEALLEHRNVNAVWEAGTIRHLKEINIGIAVAIEDGLVVPVIHDAAGLSLGAIADRRQSLVERAQAGRLKLADVQGGTFTISNLGMYSVDAFSAILNAPQAAILAVGRIADRVVAQDGVPTVLPTVFLSLALDHRVVDGARGAAFLQTLVGLIEQPLALLE